MRTKTILSILAAAAASAGVAQAACSVDAGSLVAGGNDVETAPLVVQTYADAYSGVVGHYLFGTSDPNGPPFTISSPACGAGTTIGRAAYVGSFIGPPNGLDMVSMFIFDASKIDASANKHAMRFRSVQNFTGLPFTLSARILENTGDGSIGAPGAQGAFLRTPVAIGSNTTDTGAMGPFGAPNAGVLATIMTDARHDRGLGHGSCAVAANGFAGAHDSGGGGVYFTFDRDIEVSLTNSADYNGGYSELREAIRAAQASTSHYYTCQYSCLGPTVRNVACGPDSTNPDSGPGTGIHVTHPLYVGVTAVPGGSADAARRLQDVQAVDNIIHLQGDSDFCGEDAGPGTSCRVSFVSKL